MTPIELSTRRRVTGLTSDEFARLFVSLQREVDGEAAHWSATDVESWELVGPPVTAEQHLIDTFAAANEFVATLADSWLHAMEPGQQITIRGPYGNGFPVDTDFAGKDLLFIAGGIGLAPLHSVINYCRHYRDRYGKIDIVYGSRSMEDLVDYPEIEQEWCKEDGISVHLTIDREQPEWTGHVGFVPNYVKELGFDTSKTVVMCGPPIMIKFTLAGLMELGFARDQVYTTMELRMKCALGKCGRCNIGDKYVCKDGPVFRFDQLDQLPDEY